MLEQKKRFFDKKFQIKLNLNSLRYKIKINFKIYNAEFYSLISVKQWPQVFLRFLNLKLLLR